jgi:hypothetical protein
VGLVSGGAEGTRAVPDPRLVIIPRRHKDLQNPHKMRHGRGGCWAWALCKMTLSSGLMGVLPCAPSSADSTQRADRNMRAVQRWPPNVTTPAAAAPAWVGGGRGGSALLVTRDS